MYNRRSFLKTAAATAAAGITGRGSADTAFASRARSINVTQNRPAVEHVILINADTFRRDHLASYGCTWTKSRYLDEFAARALIIDNYHTGSFPTVPNRHDLLTGRFTCNYYGWAPLPADEITFGQALQREGWYSMMIHDTANIVERGYQYNRGFTAYDFIRGQESSPVYTMPRDPQVKAAPGKLRRGLRGPDMHLRYMHWHRREAERFCARTMTSAMEWLERNYREKHWFLYIDTFDPHEPWDPPEYYVDMYNPGYVGQKPEYPPYTFYEGILTDEELHHCKAMYAAETTLVDRWIGKLLQRIDDMGLFDNTMIMFITDHGFLIGEHRFIGKVLLTQPISFQIPLYQEIAHTPSFVWIPGMEPGRTSAFIQPCDIMPTVFQLIGHPPPATVQGRSFAEVLTGGTGRHRDYTVTSPFITANPSAGRVRPTITTGEWSLMLPAKRGGNPQPRPDITDARRREAMATLERADALQPYVPELYHRRNDPRQLHNVAARNPGVVAELERLWIDFLREHKTGERFMRNWIG